MDQCEGNSTARPFRPGPGRSPARLRRLPTCLAGIGGLVLATHASAVVSSNSGTSVFNGVNINALIGAERFYSAGYWGGNAVIGNVEAGHIWNGHETLTRLSTYIDLNTSDQPRQYDWHATMVGHVLGGQGWLYGWTIGDFDTATWAGIAPSSTLWSASIATSWNADPNPLYQYTGSFNISGQSFLHGYVTTMQTGINGRKADVVNSSWGFDDPSGQAFETLSIDALAYANRTTVCVAAGNHDTGTAQVGGPAAGYNTIAVAALSPDTTTPPYPWAASFSNTAPNDFYNPKTGVTIPNVRARIDIAAPGDNLTLAFYGGLTGGHTSGTDPTYDTVSNTASGQYYIPDMGGTSFASPIVAGGAGLLVDAGIAKFGAGDATDGRVIKAVLLNSAQKLAGWNNGQKKVNGVIITTQSLDYAVGAGMIDLNRAFDQYTAGTTNVPGLGGGKVASTGWDYGQVAAGQPNDYEIIDKLVAGETLTATLTWWVNRQLDVATETATDVQFDNLDLSVWRMGDDGKYLLVASSESLYNAVEHLSFQLDHDGQYMIRVKWNGEIYDMTGDTPDADSFGLAWSATTVPEPAGLVVLALCAALLPREPRRRSATAGHR